MLNHLPSVGHKMFCLQARRISFSTENGHLQISREPLIKDVLTAITGNLIVLFIKATNQLQTA